MVLRARRRANVPGMLTVFLLSILSFSPSIFAASAVLGVDLGTEYIKAALVKPGIPLEIVLTKDSKRKETSAVAFKPVRPGSPAAEQQDIEYPERIYGGDAIALAPRFPTDVFPHLKHLLGATSPHKESAISKYSQRYPGLKVSDNAENGTITFNSQSFGTGDVHTSFSVEELLGMMLQVIRGNAERMAGSTVRDVVITIPAFYTADERRAVEFAAELAGLKVIQLISDGLAVGLNYATSRTFSVPDAKSPPEYHLVYDMGAGSTTATLLRMQGRTVRDIGRKNKTVQDISVLGVGWDRMLGGDTLNDLIVQDMARQFVDTSSAKSAGIDLVKLKQNGRAMAKFWKEAERLRQVLSANTATSGFFEDLFDGVDFRYKLSRSEFEEMSSDFSTRIGKPVEDALTGASLAMEDLTSVILHGGLVRTPFIQTKLEARVGDAAKLRGNVNADEAAVFGAAFKAADASPSFKVKEIRTNEIAGYAHAVHWKSNNKPRTQQVFSPTSQVGIVKQMPFKFLEDFGLSVSQKIPSGQSGEIVDRPVVDVLTLNLTESVDKLVSTHHCARENISTEVYIRLNSQYSLPDISKATVSCIGLAEEKKVGVVEGVKGMFGFGKKGQKTMTEDDSDDIEELEPLPDDPSGTPSSSSASSSSKTDPATSIVPKAVPTGKLTVISVSLNKKRDGRPLPPASELVRIREGLAAFDRSDKGRRLREELFNGLESFTYRVRDMLTESSFIGASNTEQRAEIEALLGTTSDWLHGEGATAGMEPIKDKLTALKALVDPVNKRKEEASKRPESTKQLEQLIKSSDNILKRIQKAADKSAAELSAVSAALSARLASESDIESETKADATELESSSISEETETSSSTTTSSDPPKFTLDPSILEKFNVFSEDDVKRLKSAIDSTSTWLADKSSAQKKLGPEEDPVLTMEDLDEAIQKLTKVNLEITKKEERIKNAEKERQRAKEKAEAKKKREEEKARKAKEKSEADASATDTPEGSDGEATTTTSSSDETAADADPAPSGKESAEEPNTSGGEEKEHDEL